jgi:hypothetical protein
MLMLGTEMRSRIHTANATAYEPGGCAFRSVAALLVAVYAAVWFAPCNTASFGFESTRPFELADLDAAHAGHQVQDPSSGHEGHHEAASELDRTGDSFALVEKCACGCGSRPEAAGVTTSPGYALFVQAPGSVSPPFQSEPVPTGLTPILTLSEDQIEHVPIRFLS